jgi:hypothetical protein
MATLPVLERPASLENTPTTRQCPELGCGAVHFADPCPGSSAYDRQAQRTAEPGSQFAHRCSLELPGGVWADSMAARLGC